MRRDEIRFWNGLARQRNALNSAHRKTSLPAGDLGQPQLRASKMAARVPAQTVGIIGAGVAGLQIAAALRHAGLKVVLFEKGAEVGGVWRANYAGYKLQVQGWHFEIPGFPWPPGTSWPYPTGQEVQAYLVAYARDAGLLPYIRLHADVKAVTPIGDAGEEGWLITYEQDGGEPLTEAVGFLVVATGLFNTPARPEWAAPEALARTPFAGLVVDARDFTDTAPAQGKHVVVVGAGKTAIDVAVTAGSSGAASTALVARKGHWWAPQVVLGVVPFEFAAYTRWSWALQPAWYSASAAVKAAHALLEPVKAAVWSLLGFLFPLHTGIPGSLVPSHGLLEGVYDTIGIVDHNEVAQAFKSGRVTGHKAEVVSLGTDTVRLSSGEELKADIIVLATGYRSTEEQLFAEKLRALAGYEPDGSHWLYRNLLPSGLHNLAFAGLNATFQHVLTTALQARWLAALLTGEFKPPSKQEVEADVAARKAWLRSGAFSWRRTNNFVWAQHGKFHDQLVADLGHAPWRRGLLTGLFAYVKNADYAFLFPGNAAAAAGTIRRQDSG